jgi:hypothetical protein
MLAVNDVGEPCAGEPRARFDGRGLETEHHGVTAPVLDPPTSRDGLWRGERRGAWIMRKLLVRTVIA